MNPVAASPRLGLTQLPRSVSGRTSARALALRRATKLAFLFNLGLWAWVVGAAARRGWCLLLGGSPLWPP